MISFHRLISPAEDGIALILVSGMWGETMFGVETRHTELEMGIFSDENKQPMAQESLPRAEKFPSGSKTRVVIGAP